MNRDDLIEIVQLARIDPTHYSLEGDRHECLCLLAQGQEWHVFSSERGTRYEEQIFSDEDSACLYFLKRLLALTSK